MAVSDKVILARDVLDAVIRVRRMGVDPLLREFERDEPELAELVLEEITTIHRRLLDCGIPAKQVRRIMHRTESLILISLAAIRQGYRRLWEEQSDERPPVPATDGESQLEPPTEPSDPEPGS